MPADAGTVLAAGGEKFEDGAKYASAVGSLLYIGNKVRPDISYIVNRLARFMHCPSSEHWKAVMSTLRYLASTPTTGITFKRGALNLQGYSDADFLGRHNSSTNSRSTSGAVYLGAGSAVLWLSRLQNYVTVSSAEAEYVAFSTAAREGAWLQNLFAFLGEKVQLHIKVDNSAARAIATMPALSQYSRQIQMHYHFVRERVLRQQLFLSYVQSGKQAADILTKILPEKQFMEMFQPAGHVLICFFLLILFPCPRAAAAAAARARVCARRTHLLAPRVCSALLPCLRR